MVYIRHQVGRYATPALSAGEVWTSILTSNRRSHRQPGSRTAKDGKPRTHALPHRHINIEHTLEETDTMRTRKEKPIFRNLTITVAGSLINPNGSGSTQWTDVNIDRWVTLRDGRFVRAMTDDVTHVVCTAEEFERRGLVGTYPFHAYISFPFCVGVVLI